MGRHGGDIVIFMPKNSVSIEIKGVQKHFYVISFNEISTLFIVFGYGEII
jgi:hypothetical protein